MNKLPVYVSESDFDTFILPQLSHKVGPNRQKVSYQFIHTYDFICTQIRVFMENIKS